MILELYVLPYLGETNKFVVIFLISKIGEKEMQMR